MDARLQTMENQLAQWGARILELAAGARQAKSVAEIDYRRGLEDLTAKYHVAQTRLEKLKSARGDRWDRCKTGVDSAWYELEIAFKKMAN